MEHEDEQLSSAILSDLLEQDDDLQELFEETPRPNNGLPEELPIMPIRNTVLFPGVVMPITVSRERSLRLVQKVYEQENRLLGIVAQRDLDMTIPDLDDLHNVGTVARIVKMLMRKEEDVVTIIIQGRRRFSLEEEVSNDPFLSAKVFYDEDETPEDSDEFTALLSSIKGLALEIIEINPELPDEAKLAIENIEHPHFLVNFISANINISLEDRQELLELETLTERAVRLMEHLSKEVQLLRLKKEITTKTHSDIDQQQRDYFLRQQIRTLQDELGEMAPEQELELFVKRGQEKEWSEETAAHFERELQRIRRMNPASPEHSITMNYLEFMLDLPWDEVTEDVLELKRAQKILDKDHHGLEKVKSRIL
ncbi:MAG: LON peptidase substrate-binding domain-containing protein, partial [Bacteroidota bacterium]